MTKRSYYNTRTSYKALGRDDFQAALRAIIRVIWIQLRSQGAASARNICDRPVPPEFNIRHEPMRYTSVRKMMRPIRCRTSTYDIIIANAKTFITPCLTDLWKSRFAPLLISSAACTCTLYVCKKKDPVRSNQLSVKFWKLQITDTNISSCTVESIEWIKFRE